MADSPISPKDFGASFKGFMEQMARQSPSEEPFFRHRLREHFGADPGKLAIVAEKFTDANHPNIHLAIETLSPRRNARTSCSGSAATRPRSWASSSRSSYRVAAA
jgi:hypothetical protein